MAVALGDPSESVMMVAVQAMVTHYPLHEGWFLTEWVLRCNTRHNQQKRVELLFIESSHIFLISHSTTIGLYGGNYAPLVRKCT